MESKKQNYSKVLYIKNKLFQGKFPQALTNAKFTSNNFKILLIEGHLVSCRMSLFPLKIKEVYVKRRAQNQVKILLVLKIGGYSFCHLAKILSLLADKIFCRFLKFYTFNKNKLQ